MTTAELTDAQTAVVTRLVTALDELGNSLLACQSVGMQPSDAFRAAGVDIPLFAGPALNAMFGKQQQTQQDDTQQ